LSLALKEYSGLTEDHCKAAVLDIGSLSVRAPFFEQIAVEFLPQSKEIFLDALKRIKTGSRRPTVLVARFEDFDAFFEAMMRTKAHGNVQNAAMGLRMWPSWPSNGSNQLAADQLPAEEIPVDQIPAD
jgi:hypothetical protein